jgi:hypothetical protein
LNDASAKAQRKNISNHLINYGRITTLEAREQYGIMSPAPRIKELRISGWNIVTERLSAVDSLGVKHDGVACYVLISFPIAGSAQ